jgi:hypothetical protein
LPQGGSRIRERYDVDLISARAIGDVGQPTPIGREGDGPLLELRHHQGYGLIVYPEGDGVDVGSPNVSLAKDQPGSIWRVEYLI